VAALQDGRRAGSRVLRGTRGGAAVQRRERLVRTISTCSRGVGLSERHLALFSVTRVQ
jgi:hypothetical protein